MNYHLSNTHHGKLPADQIDIRESIARVVARKWGVVVESNHYNEPGYGWIYWFASHNLGSPVDEGITEDIAHLLKQHDQPTFARRTTT